MSTIEILAPLEPRFDEILTPAALAFVTELHDRFGAERHERIALVMKDGRVDVDRRE